MRYEIFQTCYLPGQIKKAHAEFKILDCTEHNTSEFREVECIQQTINEGKTDALDAWGFFSPRWQDKLPHTPEQIRKKIEANPNHDVYVFGHSLARTALFANPWDELFFLSSSDRDIAKKFMAFILGDLWPIEKVYYLEFFSNHACYGNYFVAKRAFWEKYDAFVRTILLKLHDIPTEMRSISSDLFSIDTPYASLQTQVIERLLDTFLHIFSKNHKIFYIENNYSHYQKRLEKTSLDALWALYQLKQTILDPSISGLTKVQNWHALRLFALKTFPRLYSADNPFSCMLSNPEVVKI